MATSRGHFSSRLGFILAAAGSAVGLGNIWKFPFEVGDGGGAAFVVMYLVFCFLLCFPVMTAEIAIGRRTQRNAVGAFKVLNKPRWAFIGFMGIAAGLLILSFYNVVAGWAFGYVIEMLMGNFEIGTQFGDYIKDWLKIGLYGLVFMGVTAFIVSHGIQAGIERAAKILMPSLIMLMVALSAYAMTLDGAMAGIEFYLVPDFSKINGQVVYSALGQAFFSLSLGMGALITYGSYLNKDQNIVQAAAFITLMDVGIAFLAGLMLFPFVFSQGLEPTGGAGLIFVTLPGVFSDLGPNIGVIVGTLFFTLLTFAALTSTVSLLEVPVAYVVDEHKVPRKRAVWLTATFIFLIGVPSLLSNGASSILTNFIDIIGLAREGATDNSFMTFVGWIANDTFLPFGGMMISIFAAHIWKKENLSAELSLGNENYAGSFVETFINFSISYLAPFVLSMIFVLTVLSKFFAIDLL
ncbi:MAG: sodium-dependent transporter [Gammaproteobacteria bacterium]|nr:MAG: sodium-dependent transporter [Gammaproteobacteria bacterium]